ncbi:MAG: hypothetical protein V4673_05140 [Pseudomonadota bacterium]
MTADHSPIDTQALAGHAYAAYDTGDLAEARIRFETLLAATPANAAHHYMLGLVCKYLRDWPASLHHNMRALALYAEADEDDSEAPRWNAAIAATALGDWAEARRQWAGCGIDIPGDDGPIDTNFGVASLRLEAWGQAETVFARRIDPVRAQIIDVPLPDSGYRYGDIVLHDGASTGQRRFHQSMVPVLNALQRMRTSEYPTFAVFVHCPQRTDLEALIEARVPGIAFVEDWTDSIVHYCLRCSHGASHRHDNNDGAGHHGNAQADAEDRSRWRAERNLGIAAQSRHSVMRLIERWKAGGRGRRLDTVDNQHAMPTVPPIRGEQWWLSPEDRHANATGDTTDDTTEDSAD